MNILMPLNPFDHYWIIGGSTAEVYSSAKNVMLPASDPDYVEWAAMRIASRIGTVEELAEVLQTRQALPDWMFNADSFIQPSEDTYSKEQLKAYSDDKRWQKEQGGITATAGFPIRTNDRAQAKITGLYAASKEAPGVVTPYHAADGSIQQLDAAGMYALNSDLLTHINNCFEVSADVHGEIDTGTITTLEQIDAAFDAPITQARKDWLKS
jgi:hypothetical protein